jgi:mediator of RNA polymerase II transcription subunit 31
VYAKPPQLVVHTKRTHQIPNTTKEHHHHRQNDARSLLLALNLRSQSIAVAAAHMAATTTTTIKEDDHQFLKKQSKLDEEKTMCSNKNRFELELEFVQSLANPRYLHHLATTTSTTTTTTTSSKNNNNEDGDDDKEPIDILNSKEMIEYLSYLQYWYRDPRYSKYILYPHCLYFLKLLQTDEFRKAMRNPRRVEEVHVAQFTFWAEDLTERVRKVTTKTTATNDDGIEESKKK